MPHHSRSVCTVGLHYFSQVSWPVGFLVFSQLPNHSHYGLMWSLHQPVHLWVVWHGLQFLHAKEHTHFINDAAHKVSTPITQEPGWGPKDQDVTLIQKLGNHFSCLTGVTYAIMCFMKWSWNTRMLVTLGGWFSSMVVSMWVKSICRRSNGAVATMGCRGTLDKLPLCCRQGMQFLMDYCIWLIIPGHQKHSLSSANVQSWPWWPASLWHPFKVVTQWAFGATNSSKSLVLPLDIEHRYKALVKHKILSNPEDHLAFFTGGVFHQKSF